VLSPGDLSQAAVFFQAASRTPLLSDQSPFGASDGALAAEIAPFDASNALRSASNAPPAAEIALRSAASALRSASSGAPAASNAPSDATDTPLVAASGAHPATTTGDSKRRNSIVPLTSPLVSVFPPAAALTSGLVSGTDSSVLTPNLHAAPSAPLRVSAFSPSGFAICHLRFAIAPPARTTVLASAADSTNAQCPIPNASPLLPPSVPLCLGGQSPLPAARTRGLASSTGAGPPSAQPRLSRVSSA
jgi:hypothetical protein